MSIPPYAPASVGPAGLQISTYQSILQDNLQAYLNIFGANQYIAPDSAIYQLLSILSLKQSDCNLGLLLAYNQSSPQTAVGAGLDRTVKLNGLARAPFTYSIAVLTLVGVATPPTVLNNCFAQDSNGNLWAIPSGTTFVTGTINVTATCTTPGNVTAEPGAINIVATPTLGWTSVINIAPATAGNPVETDSQLRARQSISVARPSLTTLQSTIADVLAVTGVTRINPGTPTPGGPGTSIENPTGAVDYWGNPPHSISMVVEGGADLDVATAIYIARGIGCFTNGTTSVPVVDANSGYTMNISFFRPTYLPIAVFLTVIPLAGYTSATKTAIQSGIVNYLNSLSIGENVVYSELYGAALTARPNPDQPLFSITALTSGALAAQPQAALVGGNPVVTVTSAAGIAVGQFVRDETTPGHFPVGTTVSNVAGTSITLSNVAAVTVPADTLSFFTMGNTDITVPYTNVAKGVPNDVVVTP